MMFHKPTSRFPFFSFPRASTRATYCMYHTKTRNIDVHYGLIISYDSFDYCLPVLGWEIPVRRMNTFCRWKFLSQSWQACLGRDDFMDTTRCRVLSLSHP